MSGIKTEKNKKFNPININNFYQGVSNQSNKTNVVRHVGLQPLGKVGINRRQPAQQQSSQNANDTNSIAIDNSSATSSPTSSSFSTHQQHHLSQQNKLEETLQKKSSSQDLHNNSHKQQQQPVSRLQNQHQLQHEPQTSQGSQANKSQSKTTNQIEHLTISDPIVVDKEAKQKLNSEDRLVIQPLKQAELASERQQPESLAHLSPGSNSSRQQQTRGNIRHQQHDDPRVRIDNDQLNNKRANNHNSPSSGGSLSFNNKPINMVTKNSNKPRLAATQVPIVTDKELENLDNITRQTKWASGRITIDYDAKLNFSDDEDEQQQQQQQQKEDLEFELEKKQPQLQPKQPEPPETVSNGNGNGNGNEKNSTDESMNNHREHQQDPPVRFNMPRHNHDMRVRDHHSEDILQRRNNIGSKSNNYSNNSSYKSGHSNIIPNNINNSSNSNTNNSSSNYNNHTHHHHHEPSIRLNSRHNHNETRHQNANEPRYNNSSTINNITSQSATNIMNNNNICKSSTNVSNSTDNSSHSITNINQPHLGQHQQPFFTGHRGAFERPRFLRETHHQQPPHHLHHNSPPHRQHHHRNDSPPLSSSNQQRHPRLQKQHPQHQNQNRELEQPSNNKFRPVVSRVFYRSDIKRISGGKTGDNFLSKS